MNGSILVSFECSVVGRGGSRTALTGAVTMEQAGSTVGAGSARPFSPGVILLSQRAGKPRPYKTCHLGSYLSKLELSLYNSSISSIGSPVHFAMSATSIPIRFMLAAVWRKASSFPSTFPFASPSASPSASPLRMALL